MFQFHIKQIERQLLNDVSVHVWQDDLAEDFIHLVPEDAEFEVRHPAGCVVRVNTDVPKYHARFWYV